MKSAHARHDGSAVDRKEAANNLSKSLERMAAIRRSPAGQAISRDNAKRDAERARWLDANRPAARPGTMVRRKSLFRPTVEQSREDWDLHCLTWKHLKESKWAWLWFPEPGTTWRDYAVDALATELAAPLLAQLRRKEMLYHETVVALAARLACELTAILNQHTPRKVAKAVAARRYYWPVLKSRKEKYSDDHKQIVNELGVGELCPLSSESLLRAKPTSKRAIRFDVFVIHYLCRVQDYQNSGQIIFREHEHAWQQAASSLKAFSESTWREWADVAWQALVSDHGGHPARDLTFAKIGQSGIDSYKSVRKKTTLPPTTAEKAAEKRIREKFFGAVQTLAGKPRKPRKSGGAKS